jgi:hypothetical protein
MTQVIGNPISHLVATHELSTELATIQNMIKELLNTSPHPKSLLEQFVFLKEQEKQIMQDMQIHQLKVMFVN